MSSENIPVYSIRSSADVSIPKVWNLTEGYLEVTASRRYQVIRWDEQNIRLLRDQSSNRRPHWALTVLKILSYATIILPVAALLIRNHYRNKHNLDHTISRHVSVGRGDYIEITTRDRNREQNELNRIHTALTACNFPEANAEGDHLERLQIATQLRDILIRAANQELTALRDHGTAPTPAHDNSWKGIAEQLIQLHRDYHDPEKVEQREETLRTSLEEIQDKTIDEITLNRLTQAVRLSCNHVFNQETINGIVSAARTSYRGANCPYDREQIDQSSIREETVMREMAALWPGDDPETPEPEETSAPRYSYGLSSVNHQHDALLHDTEFRPNWSLYID